MLTMGLSLTIHGVLWCDSSSEICLIFLVVIFNLHPGIKHIITVADQFLRIIKSNKHTFG